MSARGSSPRTTTKPSRWNESQSVGDEPVACTMSAAHYPTSRTATGSVQRLDDVELLAGLRARQEALVRCVQLRERRECLRQRLTLDALPPREQPQARVELHHEAPPRHHPDQ